MRKAKTAIGKVSEQHKRKEKKMREKIVQDYIKYENKTSDKYERKLARLFKSKHSESYKDKQRVYLFNEMQRELNKKSRELNETHNIKIHNSKRIKDLRQQEIKRVSKLIAKDQQIKYSKVIKSSPTKLEKQGEDFNRKYLPERQQLQEVKDSGRWGLGLDYYFPYGYDYYRREVLIARKTGLVTLYMLYARFEYYVDGVRKTRELPLRRSKSGSVSLGKSWLIEDMLSESEFDRLIVDAIRYIKEEYGGENPEVLDMRIHLTVNQKKSTSV